MGDNSTTEDCTSFLTDVLCDAAANCKWIDIENTCVHFKDEYWIWPGAGLLLAAGSLLAIRAFWEAFFGQPKRETNHCC